MNHGILVPFNGHTLRAVFCPMPVQVLIKIMPGDVSFICTEAAWCSAPVTTCFLFGRSAGAFLALAEANFFLSTVWSMILTGIRAKKKGSRFTVQPLNG